MSGFDLSGRVAVVTGGSRGLGLAISRGLANAGAAIAIASRKLEACEAVAAEIIAAGGQASAHAFHAGRWADCDRLFAEVTERWGGAQILVNDVGKSPVAPSSLETSEELFDMVIDVNLKSVFRLCALFGEQMKAQGAGSIVNISSTGALRPDPSFAPYAAAKLGVTLFTETFAQEFGPEVRVNTVMPGPFHTDATKAWSRSEGFADHARRVLPLGRAGEAREIVGAVLYLASDMASFTTGACIKVDRRPQHLQARRRRAAELRAVMRAVAILLSFVLAVAPAWAEPPGGGPPQPLLKALTAQVSADRERATIARLVGFGTRHTLSDTRSEVRGVGAARRWVGAEFAAIGQACGGCLTVETPAETFTGKRVPTPTEVMDVLAIQRGTSDPDRVIVISAHLDSRVSDVMNATADAPGADDDGSGVAAVMEAARLLSQHRFPATLVFAVLSGEEQGLYGGRVLADLAAARGWRVEAVLNNDIVGNSTGQSGLHDDRHVRIFSEGTRATETPGEADKRRYNGGEVDSPSRNIARFLDTLADQYVDGLDVVMVYRTDRFGRGGDQVEMLNAGYPAVRVTEAAENYNRQHQDVRVEKGVRYGDVIDGVDFPYLAKVTRLNVVALAALASAPAPPAGVSIEGAVSPDTTLRWTPATDAATYRAWWRPTTDPQWRFSRRSPARDSATLKGVNIDDFFFGVSAVSTDGFESPVVFPGAPGSFERAPPQAPKP